MGLVYCHHLILNTPIGFIVFPPSFMEIQLLLIHWLMKFLIIHVYHELDSLHSLLTGDLVVHCSTSTNPSFKNLKLELMWWWLGTIIGIEYKHSVEVVGEKHFPFFFLFWNTDPYLQLLIRYWTSQTGCPSYTISKIKLTVGFYKLLFLISETYSIWSFLLSCSISLSIYHTKILLNYINQERRSQSEKRHSPLLESNRE